MRRKLIIMNVNVAGEDKRRNDNIFHRQLGVTYRLIAQYFHAFATSWRRSLDITATDLHMQVANRVLTLSCFHPSVSIWPRFSECVLKFLQSITNSRKVRQQPLHSIPLGNPRGSVANSAAECTRSTYLLPYVRYLQRKATCSIRTSRTTPTRSEIDSRYRRRRLESIMLTLAVPPRHSPQYPARSRDLSHKQIEKKRAGWGGGDVT